MVVNMPFASRTKPCCAAIFKLRGALLQWVSELELGGTQGCNLRKIQCCRCSVAFSVDIWKCGKLLIIINDAQKSHIITYNVYFLTLWSSKASFNSFYRFQNYTISQVMKLVLAKKRFVFRYLQCNRVLFLSFWRYFQTQYPLRSKTTCDTYFWTA